MSTRSLIGKDYGNEIKAIYCHFDGYPQHNGAILKECYSDDGKIDELIRLGDISSLGPKIDIADEFKTKMIDCEKGAGDKTTVVITIENGVLILAFFNNGIPEMAPNGDDTKSSYNVFDLRYEINNIKEICSLATQQNKEVEEYLDRLLKEIEDITIAYHRDRGESLNISSFSSEEEYAKASQDSWAEYVYLWKDGEWYIAGTVEKDDSYEFDYNFKPLRV